MKYEILENEIVIYDKQDFNCKHILECGQIFTYEKIENGYKVYSEDKCALVEENENCVKIKTNFPKYFEDFFDLKNDYSIIKNKLLEFKFMKEPIEFGYGIRILKQNLFEMLISFIISANNNIKRIQLIINRMKEEIGERKDGYFAFPTREKMLSKDEEFFKKIGAGYRAKYLYQVIRQIDDEKLNSFNFLPTEELRKELIKLMGVGPKVADCILLFGYGRQTVFPVDTWICQMYNNFIGKEENREIMRKNLVEMFGDYSGYAQQYLFFYQRSFIK